MTIIGQPGGVLVTVIICHLLFIIGHFDNLSFVIHYYFCLVRRKGTHELKSSVTIVNNIHKY